MTTDVGNLFREGRLADAVEAAGNAVRAAPTNADARILLAELLLYAGNLERADTVLDAAGMVDPSAALVVAEFRQLIRAAQGRRQVLLEGRVPDFLGQPTEAQQHLLAGLVALRSGDTAAAADAAERAEAARPAAAGQQATIGFGDFRDADDLWGGTIEALTTTGKYFWIPIERLVSLEFHPARRPRDLYWRRCSMVVHDGPDGDVYVPAVYERGQVEDDNLRLGRRTEWREDAPIRQRLFLVGEEGIAIQQLTEIEFAGAVAA